MSEPDKPAELVQEGVWQFENRCGEFVGEYTDVNLIRDDLLGGKLATDLVCRQKGEEHLRPIKDHLGKEEFRIGVLFDPVMAHVRQGAKVGGGILGSVGCLAYIVGAAIFISEAGIAGMIAMAPALVIGFILTSVVGMGLGALIGLLVGLGRRSSLQVISHSETQK